MVGRVKSLGFNMWSDGAQIDFLDSSDSGYVVTFTLTGVSLYKRTNGTNVRLHTASWDS